MSKQDKFYTIDDILREIQENKIDQQDLDRYAAEYGKFDTTALLDDILGRENILSEIEGLRYEARASEQQQDTESLLDDVPAEKPEQRLQVQKQQEHPKTARPLRPLSSSTAHLTGELDPLRRTPAMSHGDHFIMKKDHVTGLLSKVDLDEQLLEQKKTNDHGKGTGRTVSLKKETIKGSELPLPNNQPERRPDKNAPPTPAPKSQRLAPADKRSATGRQSKVALDSDHRLPISSPAMGSLEGQATETIEFLGTSIHKQHTKTIEIARPSAAKHHSVAQPSSEQVQPAPSAPEKEEASGQHKQSKQQTASSLMHDHAKLKYVALRKNRENMVKDFALISDFSIPSVAPQNEKMAQLSLEHKDLNIPAPTAAQQNPVSEPAHLDSTAQPEQATEATAQQQEPEYRQPVAQEEQQGIEADIDTLEEYTAPEQTEDIAQMLAEMKHGLVFRFTGSLILLLLALVPAVLNAGILTHNALLPILDPNINPFTYCIFYAGLSVILLLFTYDILRDSFSGIYKKRINRMTMHSVAIIATVGFSGFLLLQPETVGESNVFLYVPLLLLSVTIGQMGRLMAINRILNNFALISADGEKYAVDLLQDQKLAESFTRGAINTTPRFVTNRKTPFLSDFLSESFSDDATDRQAKYAVPIMLLVALIASGVSLAAGGTMGNALTVFTGVLITATGIGTFLVVNAPLRRSSKFLSEINGTVLGYQAVVNYAGVNSLLIHAAELFQSEDITLYGIKTFSNMPVDRAILDATSVLCESKSILSGIFMNIIVDRKDYLDPVDTILYEDGMGISGWIQDRRVLIGSREMMIHHNIDVPSKDYEERYFEKGHNLIYLSAAGELSAVFVVGISCSNGKRNVLVDLYNHGLTTIIKTVDPILTKERLAKMFGMPHDAFRVIPSRLHKDAIALEHTEAPLSGAVSNDGTLDSYVYSLLTTKQLSKSIFMGSLFNLISIGFAGLLFLLFAIMPEAVIQLSNVTLCIYQLLWLTGILAVQHFKKIAS